MTFQKPALFAFSGKEAPNKVDPFDRIMLNHGTTDTVTFQDMYLRTDLVQG
jgi:hypothetical protein